jgi:hypothetical protein
LQLAAGVDSSRKGPQKRLAVSIARCVAIAGAEALNPLGPVLAVKDVWLKEGQPLVLFIDILSGKKSRKEVNCLSQAV